MSLADFVVLYKSLIQVQRVIILKMEVSGWIWMPLLFLLSQHCKRNETHVFKLRKLTVHQDSWLAGLFGNHLSGMQPSQRGRCPHRAFGPESWAPTVSLRRPTEKKSSNIKRRYLKQLSECWCLWPGMDQK